MCITPMSVTEEYVSVTVVIKAALKIFLFFLCQPESEVETDERGFKLYDVLDALYMDEMVRSIRSWMKSPASSGVVTEEPQHTCDNLKNIDVVYILIVEGFLLYNYEPLNGLWNRRYFLTLPYEECKRRRSLFGWNKIPRGAFIQCV